jgi:hypothetical protein
VLLLFCQHFRFPIFVSRPILFSSLRYVGNVDVEHYACIKDKQQNQVVYQRIPDSIKYVTVTDNASKQNQVVVDAQKENLVPKFLQLKRVCFVGQGCHKVDFIENNCLQENEYL